MNIALPFWNCRSFPSFHFFDALFIDAFVNKKASLLVVTIFTSTFSDKFLLLSFVFCHFLSGKFLGMEIATTR